MPEQDDWPYIVRGMLAVMGECRDDAEAVLDALNWMIARAEEAGIRIRIRYRDGEVADVTEKRVAAIEWAESSGEVSFIETLDLVTITEAARSLGMSRRALHMRVMRADRAGELMPFRKYEGYDLWLAEPAKVAEWAATWTGRRAIRRKVDADS